MYDLIQVNNAYIADAQKDYHVVSNCTRSGKCLFLLLGFIEAGTTQWVKHQYFPKFLAHPQPQCLDT